MNVRIAVLAMALLWQGAIAAPAQADDPLMVMEYQPFGEIMDIYDGHGIFQREASIEDMPELPQEVLDTDKSGSFLKISGDLWLRKDFVTLNYGAVVSADLKCLVEARKGEHSTSGTYAVRGVAESCK